MTFVQLDFLDKKSPMYTFERAVLSTVLDEIVPTTQRSVSVLEIHLNTGRDVALYEIPCKLQ